MTTRKKNLGGRPPMPVEEVQSVVVQCRATVAERERWIAAAALAGTTVGAEIRKALRRLEARTASPPAKSLSRAGSSAKSSAVGSKLAGKKKPRE